MNALEVEAPADDMIANTRKIGDATAANENNGVFLEVMTLAADICPDFLTVSQANTSDFAERGVRFLRGFCRYFNADATFKRSSLVILAGF